MLVSIQLLGGVEHRAGTDNGAFDLGHDGADAFDGRLGAQA